MIELRLAAELDLGADHAGEPTGHVSLCIEADWSTLSPADRELVEALLDAVGHHDATSARPTAAAAVEPVSAPVDVEPNGAYPTPSGGDPLLDLLEAERPEPERPEPESVDEPDPAPEPTTAAPRQWEPVGVERTSPPRRAVLSALHEAGGAIVDDDGFATGKLLELLPGQTRGGLLQLLGRLKADGYVVADVTRSKRTTRIAITPAGLRVLGVEPPQALVTTPIERRRFDPDEARRRAATAAYGDD